MGIFDDLFGSCGPDVNPSTGLLMLEDSCIDVGGNPFGSDLSPDIGSSSVFDDTGLGSSFDDW